QGSAKVVVIARHLLVESSQSSFHSAVSRRPVGENPTFELEVLLQNLVEKVVILTGPTSLIEVVGAHHARRIGDSNSDLESQHIGLAQRLMIEQHVDDVSSSLLIVERIVLDVAHHMLR